MFSRLIASRPLQAREGQGLLFSVLLHGSLIAAAVMLTTQAPPGLGAHADPAPGIIYIPTKTPATARPARPAPPVPAPTPSAPPVTAIETPVVAPVAVPSTLPEPGDLPWTLATPGPPASTPGGTEGGVEGGTPLAGPPGAYAEVNVDVPASLHPRSPLPRYPEALRSWRLQGAARFTFVVDTLGRVEMPTVTELESTHPAFAAAVRASLPKMRFRPARIGAAAVRQLVEFPIAFKLAP